MGGWVVGWLGGWVDGDGEGIAVVPSCIPKYFLVKLELVLKYVKNI